MPKKTQTEWIDLGISLFNPQDLGKTSGPRKSLPRLRQVFWLSDPSTIRAFPSSSGRNSGILRSSSLITAAGPPPTWTGFPFQPSGTWTQWRVVLCT